MNTDAIIARAVEATEKDIKEFARETHPKQEAEIRVIPWKDFVNREFEEPRWIVKNMIPEKGLVAIAGSPESYKSFFAAYIAIKVAKGESILDKFETVKTSVLIIDQENIPAWLHQRLTRLSQDEDLSVYIFDKDVVPFDLFEESIFDQILEFIEENEIGLVIIDTLRLTHNKEENSSTDMKSVVDKLKEIAKRAATVFIHHNRKMDKRSKGAATGEDMMGSILIRGAVDYQLTFTNLGEQPDGLTKLKIAQTKARYTRPIKTFEVSLEESDGKFLFVYEGELEEEKLKREEAKEAILALLAEQSWKRQDIIDQLASEDISGSRTSEDALKELLEEEKIKHTRTKPHIYSLVEDTESNIPHSATTNSDCEIAESLLPDIPLLKNISDLASQELLNHYQETKDWLNANENHPQYPQVLKVIEAIEDEGYRREMPYFLNDNQKLELTKDVFGEGVRNEKEI